MRKKVSLGLDPLIERAQAWNDASTRYPVVRVVGDDIQLIKNGVVMTVFPSSCVTGFIFRLESARESVRARTVSLMNQDLGAV